MQYLFSSVNKLTCVRTDALSWFDTKDLNVELL